MQGEMMDEPRNAASYQFVGIFSNLGNAITSGKFVGNLRGFLNNLLHREAVYLVRRGNCLKTVLLLSGNSGKELHFTLLNCFGVSIHQKCEIVPQFWLEARVATCQNI